jgi:hypothetical protein
VGTMFKMVTEPFFTSTEYEPVRLLP